MCSSKLSPHGCAELMMLAAKMITHKTLGYCVTLRDTATGLQIFSYLQACLGLLRAFSNYLKTMRRIQKIINHYIPNIMQIVEQCLCYCRCRNMFRGLESTHASQSNPCSRLTLTPLSPRSSTVSALNRSRVISENERRVLPQGEKGG